jgi:hypothetical protein
MAIKKGVKPVLYAKMARSVYRTVYGGDTVVITPALLMKLVTDGDSLSTFDFGASDAAHTWPAVGRAALTGNYTVTLSNVATSGYSLQNMIDEFSTRAGAQFDSSKALNIYTILGGTNFAPVTQYVATYRALRTLTRKAAAAGFQRIVIATIPSKDLQDGNTDDSFDANTLPYNVAIRAYATNDLNCDAVIDIAANASFDTASDADSATIYFDKEHIRDPGHAIIGGIAASTWQPLLAAPGVRTAAPGIWSPFDRSNLLSYTNDQRTMSWPNSNDATASARSFCAMTSGKYAWEIVVDNANNVTTGVCNQAAETSIQQDIYTPGQDSNSIAWDEGNINLNNVSVASMPTLVTGDIVQHAVDFTNKLFWVRKSTGLWNNNATANPVTGVGGISIAALGTGPLYAVGFVYNAPGQLTARFLASQMSAAITGFSAMATVAVPDVPVSSLPATLNFVAGIDSLTDGLGATSRAYAHPAVANNLLSSSITKTLNNIGVSGRSMATAVANYATDGPGFVYDATKAMNLVSLLGGTNDTPGSNWLPVFRNIRAYLRLCTATGYNRKLVATLTSRNNQATADGSFSGNTLPLNIAIRALYNSELDCDALVDYAANTNFDTVDKTANTAVYYDTLHMVNAGYAIMGQIEAAAINSVLAAPGVRVKNPATWSYIDYSSAYLTLSNSNRSLAWTATGNSAAGARGFIGKKTGKYAWEIVADISNTGDHFMTGLCNQAFEVSFWNSVYGLGSTANSVGWKSTTLLVNNATVATMPQIATGDVIQHAVDFDAKLYWVRKVGGNWNGSATANPTTGVGGIDISILGTGLIYPAAVLYSSVNAATTSRFAASEMSAQVSGFTALGS